MLSVQCRFGQCSMSPGVRRGDVEGAVAIHPVVVLLKLLWFSTMVLPV